MRQAVRDALREVERRIEVATLCWIDVACLRIEFSRADVWRELKRRQEKDRRYPRPTPLQFDAGLKQAIAENVLERSGQIFKSKIKH